MGGLPKAAKQEELQDSEPFSGDCYPTAASCVVFFSEAGFTSASPLMLPKTPVILRSQLQDMAMDKKAEEGRGVCQRLLLLQAWLGTTGGEGTWARETGDVGQGSVELSGAVFSSLPVSSLLRQEQTATAFSQQVLLLAWDVCALWFLF